MEVETRGRYALQSHPVAPFLKKTYDLIDDPATDKTISWGKNNDSLVIWNKAALESDILPNYFNSNNSSSFIRQLNAYGFHRIGTENQEFAHVSFQKGKKHLLAEIHRKKSKFLQGRISRILPMENTTHNQQPMQERGMSSNASNELDNAGQSQEMKQLNMEKNALTCSLATVTQNLQNTENEISKMWKRVGRMEKNHNKVISVVELFLQHSYILMQPRQAVEQVIDTIKGLRVPCSEQDNAGGLEDADCQSTGNQLPESSKKNCMPTRNGNASSNLQQANRANSLGISTVLNNSTQPGKQMSNSINKPRVSCPNQQDFMPIWNGNASSNLQQGSRVNGTAQSIMSDSVMNPRVSCPNQGVAGGLEDLNYQNTKNQPFENLKPNFMPLWNGNVSSNDCQSSKNRQSESSKQNFMPRWNGNASSNLQRGNRVNGLGINTVPTKSMRDSVMDPRASCPNQGVAGGSETFDCQTTKDQPSESLKRTSISIWNSNVSSNDCHVTKNGLSESLKQNLMSIRDGNASSNLQHGSRVNDLGINTVPNYLTQPGQHNVNAKPMSYSIKNLRGACSNQGVAGGLETSDCQSMNNQLPESLKQSYMTIWNSNLLSDLQHGNRNDDLGTNSIPNYLTQPGQQNGTANSMSCSVKNLEVSCPNQGDVGGLGTSDCQSTRNQLPKSLEQNFMPAWNGNLSSNLEQANRVNNSGINTVPNILAQLGKQNGTAELMSSSIKIPRVSCPNQRVANGFKHQPYLSKNLKQNLMAVGNGDVPSNLQQAKKVNDLYVNAGSMPFGTQSSVLAQWFADDSAYTLEDGSEVDPDFGITDFEIPDPSDEFDFPPMQGFKIGTSQNDQQIEASGILGKRKLP